MNLEWEEPALLYILVLYAIVSASSVVFPRRTSVTTSLVTISRNGSTWDGENILTCRFDGSFYQSEMNIPWSCRDDVDLTSGKMDLYTWFLGHRIQSGLQGIGKGPFSSRIEKALHKWQAGRLS
jgi:hypothetical protein